ncbi:MAG: hypothetical protein RLZZ60_1545 [Bacteroidota bacterium]|jgi:thiol-disulfide isomerase/thioredoxin
MNSKITIYFYCLFYSVHLLAGQNNPQKTLKAIKEQTLKQQSLSFNVERTIITFNSFDLSSEVDTVTQHEKYDCYRNGKWLSYLKTSINKHDTVYEIYNSKDSFGYVLLKNESNKIELPNIKYVEFSDCFLLLGNNNDSILIFAGDSLVQTDKFNFKNYHTFEDEYGPGIIETSYKINLKNEFCEFEKYFNQEYLLPKTLTQTRYSNISYKKTVSKQIKSQFETKYQLAKFLFQKKQNINLESNNYKTIEPRLFRTNLRVTRGVQSFALDSLIDNSKISLLYFWFEGCEPCQQIKPYITTIYETNNKNGLNIIGLNCIDQKDVVLTTNTPYINYKVDNTILKQLGISGYPTVVVFNSNNELIGLLNGFNPNDIELMKSQIHHLLNK